MKFRLLIGSLCLFWQSTGVVHANVSTLLIFTEDSPPYQFQAEGKVAGLATKRVRAIVDHAGLNAEVKLYPWARAMKYVKSSARGLIYSIAKSPEREGEFHWIAPVARFELALVALSDRDNLVVPSWEDLVSYSFAAQRGDIAYQWLQKQGVAEAQILSCADISCSWQQLLHGTVDFIIEDPSLIATTASSLGVEEHHVRVVKLIPELSLDAYLAANKRMDGNTIEKLRQAAKDLNYIRQ